MKKRLVLYGIFFLAFVQLGAQNANIAGVINSYALGIRKLDATHLNVGQIATFNLGDTILIIQMQGAHVNLSNTIDFGTVTNMGNTGNYEFSIVTAVDGTSKIITLRCPLINNYDDSLFQVVKVKSFMNATITSDLTCQPWDGQKGGVLAIFVYGTLTFNANMDVSGKGFKGAVPANANTIAVCSSIGNITNYYYTINGWDSAGIKGEGIARLPLFYARGRGKIANGGGGGNSLNSAGGGGSNAGIGGKGGKESGICIPQGDVGGIGGQVLTDVPAKFFMGGGGGCGTFEQLATNASKGGNGGGIVFVLANTIIGNSKQIIANGEALTAMALDNGSGGGGGGGGTIVLNSSQINGTLSLLSKGGNGSSCSSANTQCRGSGGGGGGGWICLSNNINPTADVSGGTAGTAGVCPFQGYEGVDGDPGSILNNFIMPLSCLLDNIIQADQTICYGTQPQMLTGTTSAFIVSYQWQCSTDNVNWNNCPATNTQPNYQSGTLYQTTYFRRITIYSNGDITNSNVVTITINPFSINLQSTAIYCYGLCTGTANVIVTPSGSNYSYYWNTGATASSLSGLCANNYSVTVTDANGCTKTGSIPVNQPSSALSITLSKTDVTCFGQSNGSASVVATGGTSGYIYHWSNNATTHSIANIPAGNYSVTVTDQNGCTATQSILVNQPLLLTIHLTVQQPTCAYNCDGNVTPSAQGGTPPYQFVSNIMPLTNLCAGIYHITVTDAHSCYAVTADTLTPLTIIQNNFIDSNSLTVCNHDTVTINGSTPSGAGTFTFYWKISLDNQNWGIAPPTNYNPDYIWLANQSNYFRRVVLGGGCYDTSNTVFIKVITINNHISTSDTILCSYEAADTIHGNTEASYSYSWQHNTGSGWVSDTITTANFIPSGNNPNMAYRRIVDFNGCADTSNVIHIYRMLFTNNILIDNIDTMKQYCELAQGSINGVISGTVGAYLIHWQLRVDTASWYNLTDTTSSIIFSWNNNSQRYSYYYRIIENSGCFDTSNIVIIDKLPPIIGNLIQSQLGLGSSVHICPNKTIWLGSLNYQLNGGTGFYTYLWKQSNDSLVWDNAISFNNYSFYNTPALTDTTYYIRVVTSGVCIDTSNIFTIYVTPLPPNQITCNHTTFCQGSQPDSIYETQPTSVPGLVYQWQLNNNGNWVNITGTNHPNYLPPYTLGPVIYRRVMNLNSCSDTSNQVTITCYQQPSMTYSLTESDTLCLVPNLLVHIPSHLTGTSPWHVSYNVNGTNYSFEQIHSDTTYQVPINQSYTWIAVSQLSDSGGCPAALNTDTIKIWGYNPVNAQATSMESCGLNATLQATSSTQGVGVWHLPTGINATDTHNPHAQITASAYGSYPLIWEVSNGPCLDTAQISVVFYQQPQLTNAGIDVTLDQISPVLLQATVASVGTGTWSVTQGNAVFTNIHAPNATASSFDEGNNILRWTVVNGVCHAVYDDITITLRTLIVPEGFSPNGDNVNDLFVIKGLDISKEYNLIVFNRWGNVVYDKKPYDNTWDGKDKNQNQLPDDTYFYILKKDNKVYKNGYVVLKR